MICALCGRKFTGGYEFDRLISHLSNDHTWSQIALALDRLRVLEHAETERARETDG